MEHKPKVILTDGVSSITLTMPELRVETVEMIMADARTLINKLHDATVKMRVILGEQNETN